jgi:hypothetical protein
LVVVVGWWGWGGGSGVVGCGLGWNEVRYMFESKYCVLVIG